MATLNIRLVITLTVDEELINDSIEDFKKALEGHDRELEWLMENIAIRGWKPNSIIEDIGKRTSPAVIRLARTGASVGAEYVDMEMEY